WRRRPSWRDAWPSSRPPRSGSSSARSLGRPGPPSPRRSTSRQKRRMRPPRPTIISKASWLSWRSARRSSRGGSSMGMPDQSVSLPISMKSTRGRWTMTAVILGSGIVFLDSTVVNVALPHIGKDLPSHLFGVLEGESYVYSAYLLTLSALLILAGALSDYYGRRKMFALGLVGFGAMSLACGLAPNLELLILFRILQA